jgi:FAD:protein FMN transferase
MLLIRVSRRAMACEFEVCYPAASCENATDFAIESLDLVESLEDRLSYFRPESDIARINRLAAETPVEVDTPLFDLLRLAMRISEETGGAYDITSTPLWETWGFARRAGQIPSETQLAEARSCVGAHLLELDATRQTIRFRKPGVKINLASIGKGYALDLCSERLLTLGMTDFLLHGGQSSVLARGSSNRSAGVPPALSKAGETPALQDNAGETPALQDNAGETPALQDNAGETPALRSDSWEIGLPDPRQPSRRLAVVRLRDRALGTSSDQFQSFRHRGRRYGHILDPRTGWPAEGVLSSTVVASSAALADALSTAFYAMGPQQSLSYCETHPKIGMVMLCSDPRTANVQIHRAGLSDTELAIEGE